MKSNKRTEVKSIVCGAATGAANGLFGGGGGMIAVPLLRAQGLEEKRAHATAIAVILPVSLEVECVKVLVHVAAFVSVVCVPRIF